jgi:hypothetical protein
VAVVVLTIGSLMAPAGALTPLAQADVAAFTSRAEAWTDARDDYRDSAHEQALELAEAARQAELDRVAAEEADRIAEAERRTAEEVARTSTTTSPPTTTTAAPATTAAPTTTAPSTVAAVPPASGQPSASQWAVLRQCEASGNYGAVSVNGRYRGVYQFSQATWDWIARISGSPLVGVDPATASPGDQDAMALALWGQRGWSPWPICGAQAAAS